MAAEQVALRRVATLVASGASPPAVFCAVAKELAQLFGVSVTLVLRFEDFGTAGRRIAGRKHDPVGIQFELCNLAGGQKSVVGFTRFFG